MQEIVETGPEPVYTTKRIFQTRNARFIDDAPLFSAIGALIAAEGTDEFPIELAAFLRTITPYDFTVIFGYRGTAQPIDLFDDFPARKRAVFVTDYQAGPYLLDPFCLAATKPVAPALYRMRDLAPDRFYRGEYFRSYYIQTGLAEEIGFFVDTGRGTMVIVSLMRAKKPFSSREFAALAQAAPVVDAAVARQWRTLAETFDRPVEAGGHGSRDEIEHELPALRRGPAYGARTGGGGIYAQGPFGRSARPGARHLAGNSTHSPAQRLRQARHFLAGRAFRRFIATLART